MPSIFAWIFIVFCFDLGFVECELIGNNTFTINSNIPINDGLWRASGTCNTIFPGISYTARETYIVSRFGVPILTYKDYLGGTPTEMAPNGKWVISNVGYNGGHGSLSYSLEFTYDVWMGAKSPSGDCYQFRGRQAAEDFANTAPELTDTPEDTLIDTKAMTMGSSGHSISQASCIHSFAGISVGAREAIVLIYFAVPVQYQSDYFGGTVFNAAADSTWFMVKDAHARSNVATYTFNFKFKTTDRDVSKATCFLYASESDAVLSAASFGATTTTVGTTDLVYFNTSGGITPQTVTTTVQQGTVVRDIISHTPRTNATSGLFVESRGMRKKYVGENSLWTKYDVNLLQCIRACLADVKCVSAFFLEENSECTGHYVIYGSGDALSGVLYYVYRSI